MAVDRSAAPAGKKFDFDRVLAEVPDAVETVRATEAVVAAGELIRQARVRKGISQVTLAKRVGTTQPHVSEIERGIGENGPSVRILSRLLRELDDTLLVLSRKEQARWMAERIEAAEAAVGELAEAIARDGVTDMVAVMAKLAEVNTAEQQNPFKNTLLNGLILGIYMTLRAQSGTPAGAVPAGISRQIVEGLGESRFAALFRPNSETN